MFTAYLGAEQTGFAQRHFAYVCESCQFFVTREALAVAKFVNDLMKDPENLEDVIRFECAVYLP
jgi:hypothetical protein